MPHIIFPNPAQACRVISSRYLQVQSHRQEVEEDEAEEPDVEEVRQDLMKAVFLGFRVGASRNPHKGNTTNSPSSFWWSHHCVVLEPHVLPQSVWCRYRQDRKVFIRRTLFPFHLAKTPASVQPMSMSDHDKRSSSKSYHQCQCLSKTLFCPTHPCQTMKNDLQTGLLVSLGTPRNTLQRPRGARSTRRSADGRGGRGGVRRLSGGSTGGEETVE